MLRGLAGGNRAVVTTGTDCGDASVIKPSARKSHCALVTCLARIIRSDVFCRLSECRPSVVTTSAIRNDSDVIHASSGERHRALMAILAGNIGDDVVYRFAERGLAVVTVRASRRGTEAAVIDLG